MGRPAAQGSPGCSLTIHSSRTRFAGRLNLGVRPFMSPPQKRFPARLLIAALVFLCTIQALYWPLLMKPGTELGWWQIDWMAKVGYVIGAPVMVLAFWVSGLVLVLAAVLWSLLVYWLSGLLIHRFRLIRETVRPALGYWGSFSTAQPVYPSSKWRSRSNETAASSKFRCLSF
jgi:hypothetical protein